MKNIIPSQNTAFMWIPALIVYVLFTIFGYLFTMSSIGTTVLNTLDTIIVIIIIIIIIIIIVITIIIVIIITIIIIIIIIIILENVNHSRYLLEFAFRILRALFSIFSFEIVLTKRNTQIA